MWTKCIGPGLSLPPSDHGCSIRGLQDIEIEDYKTLKQIWGGIAINVKRAVIPDIFA
jgi:hypothetical protein